jgi:LPXTG-site transpeptidase (sortase) family protein
MRRRSVLIFVATVLVGIAAYVGSSVTTVTVYSSERPPITTPIPTPTPVKTTPPVQEQATIVAAVQPVKQQAAPTVVKGNSLSIASIGFQAPIVDVGVTADNAIDVPATKVGRWIGSAQPGMPGAVFLDGHVDGVFTRLNKLAVGQTISMVYGGQTFRYQVVFTEVVSLAGIDMSRSLSVYGGNSEGLNIMTCAGTYIPSAGTYDKRLVVYAVRVS